MRNKNGADVSGTIHYWFATSTLVYASVKDKPLFDAFPLPLDASSTNDVLIKTVEMNGVTMIYQYWINPPTIGGAL